MGFIDPFASRDPFDADPFASPKDPFSSRPFAKPPVVRPDFRVPLPDEESKSFGRQILDTGASGLGYVGGTLAKPGEAVRNLLAGRPGSAFKMAIPFSESLGLASPEDHMSGRRLLDQYGMTDKNDKGWGSWGAGLAADLATDPLVWASLGTGAAKTGIGHVLEKAGLTKGWTGEQLMKGFGATESGLTSAGNSAAQIAHMADQGTKIASPAAEALGATVGAPLSGLVRFGVPFMPKSGFVLGTGPTAQAIQRGLHGAGEAIRFGNPVGRAIGSLFDSRLHGATSEIGQKGALKYLDPAYNELGAAARGDTYNVLSQLDPIIKGGTFPEADITGAARAVAEDVPHQFDPALTAQVTPVATGIRDIEARRLLETRQSGAPIKNWNDPYAEYVRRQALDASHANIGLPKSGNMYPVTSSRNIARETVFNDIPGGSNYLDSVWRRFGGKAGINTTPIIRSELERDFIAGGGVMDPAGKMAGKFDSKAEALADRVLHADPSHSTNALPLYSPNLAGDVIQGGAAHARTVASARGAIGTIADVAKPIGSQPDLIPLSKVMRDLKLVTYGQKAMAGKNLEGAFPQMYRALAPQGAGMVDPYLTGSIKNLGSQVDRFGVTPEHYAQITQDYAKWAAPEQIKLPLKGLDSFTNMFKALAYPMWIPAHVRNAATAEANLLRSTGIAGGIGDKSAMMGIMRGTADAPQLARYGLGSIDEARQNLFTHGNVFGGMGQSDDVSRSASQALLNTASQQGPGRFTPMVPGADRVGSTGSLVGDALNLVGKEGMLDTAKATGNALRESIGGALSKANYADPTRRWGQSISEGLAENLGIKGVGGLEKDVLPAVKAGRTGGMNIEDFYRGSQMLAEVRGGASWEKAGEMMNKYHFDYDALTPFEKSVMKRAAPFYTFTRKNLPLQLETMATRPGITSAWTKPLMQETPGEDGYVPAYLKSGAALGLGPEVDGKKQFLSKVGLPAEEAFEKMHFKNGVPDIPSTALEYMGQMNPLFKAPLEQLFDTQFHSQRKLSDLRASGTAGAIGQMFGDENPQLLGQIMSNSPFTRFFTTIDKLADPRKSWWQKGLNTLTGAQVTDVDMDKQRAIEMRNALDTMMKGHSNLSQYQSFYVKPEDQAKLTPQEVELMREYSGLQDAARAFSKSQKVVPDNGRWK